MIRTQITGPEREMGTEAGSILVGQNIIFVCFSINTNQKTAIYGGKTVFASGSDTVTTLVPRFR